MKAALALSLLPLIAASPTPPPPACGAPAPPPGPPKPPGPPTPPGYPTNPTPPGLPGNGTSPKPAPGLGDLAQRAGLLYFGTAIDNVVLDNAQYTNIAFNKSEFNQVTPSNGQKWVNIEPQRNVFNYTLGDQVIVPGQKAGQMARCHTFLWHSQLPNWLNNGNWTATELWGILENHIKNEAKYYWGDCYAWDVGTSDLSILPPVSLQHTILTMLYSKRSLQRRRDLP